MIFKNYMDFLEWIELNQIDLNEFYIKRIGYVIIVTSKHEVTNEI